MGGDSQPQILLQLLCRWLHHGQSPGRAVASPRWVLSGSTGFDTWTVAGGAHVRVEADAPAAWADGLRSRGHDVATASPAESHGFGHAHLLERTTAETWAGASDPRTQVGAATGW
jgi:gamma-glutamyltranspeptidase/glutathione hydrolase